MNRTTIRPPLRLGVGMVLYAPDLALVTQTLVTLHAGVVHARTHGLLRDTRLYIVDHSPQPLPPTQLAAWQQLNPQIRTEYEHHPANPGFGSGMNRCFRQLADADVLLACNPDLSFAPDSLTQGLTALLTQHVGLVAPMLVTAGTRQPACFRQPDVLTLLIRGFAPTWLRQHFHSRLARYAYLDHPVDQPLRDPDIVSGCCMLMSAQAYAASGGFDEGYFMYFEDFDLSIRLRQLAGSVYWPAMQVGHVGGGASRKGWRHILWFARSAWRFLRRQR